jgi:DGQHR domain-containing protein
MANTLKFKAVRARQSDKHQVLSFAAKASDIHKIASIDRISRNESGVLTGFQRPQITTHINEIRDYLKGDDAVLPNPIVVAFTGDVTIKEGAGSSVTLTVDLSNGVPGVVVDGQQRLTALSGLPEKEFEVFVSALLCRDEEELRRQFILINNTRPLPKSLIYELLPSVDGLPDRMSSRSRASKLTDALNYQEGSSLKGQIKQHTNPDGIVGDTSIQRFIMNSLADGACRELIREPDGEEKCFNLISCYFEAIQEVFANAWIDRTPKSSRLVHGAGVVSMGYVMEFLFARDKAMTKEDFVTGILPLKDCTAWVSGEWYFGDNETRPWNGIQNLHRDIQMLASYLTRSLKRAGIARVVPIKSETTST